MHSEVSFICEFEHTVDRNKALKEVRKIASSVGTVKGINEGDLHSWWNVVRVGVEVVVNKPVRRGIMIAQQSGSKVWVYFRYEKSQNFCYSCGMLVHVLHKCASECKFADDGSFPYGPGLRASPLQKRYVSGSYRMRTASG
ncbi:hypothetical protein GH714_019533 [Hevea brasiliensis]|uniref:Zinc knuckle CX2CX4HX4C domain-containing protein n=1 Tax=Hevea brasiliensis TaxID=3981 RepID=A0A6A6MF77_HEVBR|nr:hypothetical protein GH714_019533 [Hevea brasiliensis]